MDAYRARITELEIDRVDSSDSAKARHGEVIELDDQAIVVRARDSAVRLSGLMTEDLAPVARQELVHRYSVDIGAMLVGESG